MKVFMVSFEIWKIKLYIFNNFLFLLNFSLEPNEIAMKNKQNFINLHSNLDDIVKRKSLEVSMSRSEQPQACNLRNKLQKSHTTQLQR